MSKKPRKINNYRSKFEQKVAANLRERKIKFEYETEKLPFTQPASKHVYKPDFILPNGIICEVKGKFDNASRKKMAIVCKEYEGKKDIRMLFMRDQPLQKGAKQTYGEWCDARSIPWAVGEIPQSWLDED